MNWFLEKEKCSEDAIFLYTSPSYLRAVDHWDATKGNRGERLPVSCTRSPGADGGKACKVGHVGFGAKHKQAPQFFPTYWLTWAGDRLLSSAVTVSCSVGLSPGRLTERITKDQMEQRVSECGRRTSSISPTWDLVRFASCWLHPRPTE